jgi:hypothetical protein
MSNQVDKVNMSLDDIIKMNRKNKGPNNKFGGGNNQQKQQQQRPQGNGQNRRRPGQNQRQNHRGGFQNQQRFNNNNKNNFGLLNNSKTIQKNKRPTNQNNRQNRPTFTNQIVKQQMNKPALPQMTFKSVVLQQQPQHAVKKTLAAKKTFVRRPQSVFNR